jgi:hypothetical protein
MNIKFCSLVGVLAATLMTIPARAFEGDQVVVVHGSLSSVAKLFEIKEARIQGDVVSVGRGVNLDRAKNITSLGFNAFVHEDSKIDLRNCTDALLTIFGGIGEYEFIPPNTDKNSPVQTLYRMSEIVSFTCSNPVP